MNIYTHEIAKILNVSTEVALAVQHEMECNQFDFSEATERQFRQAVKLAQKELMS